MNSHFDESRMTGLQAWRTAVASGADIGALLRARHARVLAEQAQGVWIHVCDTAQLSARIEALSARRREFPDPGSLLRAMPLFGVPFAIKDNIDAAGMPTTAACPAWQRVPARGATVVQRLLDAGAVLLGKTNLDQFATGLVGARSPYGVPSSVFDPDRVSGGSSAGSAVAVARGDVAFSLGTDTAGSGRIPAGFNGLVGLKPTPGRVSTVGVLPACRTLDCVSVFAHAVDDAAAVLSVIEGADPDDDYSDFFPGRSVWPGALPRVLVPSAPGRLEDGYDASWSRALAAISNVSRSVGTIDFEPLFEVARLLYEGPWVAERYSVVRALIESNPAAMDATVASVISNARRFSAVDTFQAQYQLQRARRALDAIWQDADVLMVPTAPRHPTHAALSADPVGVNAQLGRFTNFVNLLGWCALAVPAGFTRDGLPFGVTFIARRGDDAVLARWANAWERLQSKPGTPISSVPQSGESDLMPALPAPATEPSMPIAAVGAHMSGLALNAQLTERRAVLRERTHTAAAYRLFALPGTTPPRPGMVRVASEGGAIEVEVWDVPVSEVGGFLSLIPAPLGLGLVELADGRKVHGFLCESVALSGARDISHFGGWRGYLASLVSSSEAPVALVESLPPD